MTLNDADPRDTTNEGQEVWSSAAVAVEFPPLHPSQAVPLAQDRWERLVSSVTVPYPAEVVWAAITDPASVQLWLGVCDQGWAVAGEESTLDFEDGEFFYCATQSVEPATDESIGTLSYLWRWVGIGPATRVTWSVLPTDTQTTTVTVTEEATNPPSDWRMWNGMGWPGILSQLANHLRTKSSWRWPWRRMGPYVQAELGAPPMEAWEALTSAGAVKHWLKRTAGSFTVGDSMRLTMGDASGSILLETERVVEAGQEFPAYLPYVEFNLRREGWERPLGGRLWIEPSGLGRSLLQVFLFNWESLPLADPIPERRILTNYWILALGHAQGMFAGATFGTPHLPPHPG